jgi:hypothetical protein
MSRFALACSAFALFFCSVAGCAADKPATEEKAKPYPLQTCIVSDEEFGGDMGDPIVKVYDGREVKFCCKSCVGKYEKNKEAFNVKLDAAVKDAAKTDKVGGDKAGAEKK